MHIIYKADPDLDIMDWLSHNNHKESKIQEIEGMKVNMKAISMLISIPTCTSKQDIPTATCEDVHLQEVKTYNTGLATQEGRSRPKE